MAIPQPSSTAAALVIDANVFIVITSNETGRDTRATAEINRFTVLGYDWYAPGVVVSETLFALCSKVKSGALSTASHSTAIQAFHALMVNVLPPPKGENDLIQRAEQIMSTYGCSRSADSLYIALAGQLSKTMPTTLLTFDRDLPKQASKNAPSVTVLLMP